MSVSTESVLTSYAGDGSTTVFATGFPFFEAADLVVTLEDNSFNTFDVQTLGSDYTVSGGQVGNGQPNTGSVTFTTAPAAGNTVHIRRRSDFLQETDLVDNTAQRAEVVESSLDHLATYVQELRHSVDRAIRVPGTDAALSDLAGEYPRRDTVVGFDENGDLTLLPAGDVGGGGGAVSWGDITGTLADQADLLSALNAKVNTSVFNTHLNDDSNPHETAFSNLEEGAISATPSSGDLIRFDGTNWVNTSDAISWGEVGGTLADQTDLQAALDLKLESVDAGDLNTSTAGANGEVLTLAGGGLTWSSPTGRVWQTEGAAPTLGDDAFDVAYSADGKFLAVVTDDDGSGNNLVVYDLNNSNTVVHSVADSSLASAGRVEFSPDSAYLAVADAASAGARVFETSGWTEETIPAHPSGFGSGQDVGFSQDSSMLAIAHIGTSDGLIVLDVSSWARISGTPTINDDVRNVAFGNGSQYLAVGYDTSPHLTVYAVSGWGSVGDAPDSDSAVADLAWLQVNHTYFAVAKSGSIAGELQLTVYDYSDSPWSVAFTKNISGLSAVQFSPDGKYLATGGSASPRLWVYDLADTSSALADVPEFTDTVEGLDFSYDSRRIAVAINDNAADDAAAYLATVDKIPTAAVTSVNGLTGTVVLDSDTITEGASNLYHTDARAVAAIKADPAWNASDWDTAFGWGDHSAAGYLTSETDPVFGASEAASITATDTNNWDTAFGWGNHASAGYLTAVLPSNLTATNSPADGQVPSYDNASGQFTWTSGGGGGGASAFTGLSDTPSSYSGVGGQLAAVNAGETALEFTDDVSGQKAFVTGTSTLRTLRDRFKDTVHVKDFGAVGNGIADDAPAIQAAIDSGADRILLGPLHRIASTIQVRRSGVHIQGTGIQPLEASSAGDDSTTLKWGGATGGTMFYVSPAAAPNNQLITGVRVEGVTVDGNESAARGFVLESCRWCRFYLSAGNCTEYQIITGCAYETSGPNRDFQFNECAFFARANGSANGVYITRRSHEPGPDSDQQGNSSLNHFIYIDVRADDGVGVTVGYGDNNIYERIRVYSYGAPAHQLLVRGTHVVGSHTEKRCKDEYFNIVNVRAGHGPITIEGTDATGVTAGAEDIWIANLDKGNGTPDPTIGTGANCFYTASTGEHVGHIYELPAIGDTSYHAGEAARLLRAEGASAPAMWVQTGSSIWAAFSNSPSDRVFDLRTDGTNRAQINFPTTDGTERFRINAPLYVTSLTETSDIALKDNVHDLERSDCLAAIRSLQPRAYTWKDSGLDDVGLVAQEVAEKLPGLVAGGEDEDDESPLGVRYTKLIPYLIGAVQALADALANRHGRL